jgi:hypothetical protein
MNENESDIEVNCTEEETTLRLSLCKGCEMFEVNENGMTQCKSSGCLINLMTTFKFKICPIGRWT